MKTNSRIFYDFKRYMESEQGISLIEGEHYRLKQGSERYNSKLVVFTDESISVISEIFEWAWYEQQDRIDEIEFGDDY